MNKRNLIRFLLQWFSLQHYCIYCVMSLIKCVKPQWIIFVHLVLGETKWFATFQLLKICHLFLKKRLLFYNPVFLALLISNVNCCMFTMSPIFWISCMLSLNHSFIKTMCFFPYRTWLYFVLAGCMNKAIESYHKNYSINLKFWRFQQITIKIYFFFFNYCILRWKWTDCMASNFSI